MTAEVKQLLIIINIIPPTHTHLKKFKKGIIMANVVKNNGNFPKVVILI